MSFHNKQPLPIEDRVRYAESIGLKRLDITPIENMNPSVGPAYLDFQREYADHDIAALGEVARATNAPQDKIRKHVEKLEHLLGLMTDNSPRHQADFLGFRMARESLSDAQLASIIYSHFLLAEQMMRIGNYSTNADTLMSFGAGFVAAKKFGAREIIDAKKFAVGSIKEVYKNFPHLQKILPAMGYSKKQVHELEQTINRSNADIVVSGTPINIAKDLKLKKEIITVRYELKEKGANSLVSVLKKFLR